MGKQDAAGKEIRQRVSALVQAAGAGRADLAWLVKAIRRAGFVPAGDALTRADVTATAERIAAALERAAEAAQHPCCKETLTHATEALARLAAGG